MGRCYPGACGNEDQADIKGVMVGNNNLLEELKAVSYSRSEGILSILIFEGRKCVEKNSRREFEMCDFYPSKNEKSSRNF